VLGWEATASEVYPSCRTASQSSRQRTSRPQQTPATASHHRSHTGSSGPNGKRRQSLGSLGCRCNSRVQQQRSRPDPRPCKIEACPGAEARNLVQLRVPRNGQGRRCNSAAREGRPRYWPARGKRRLPRGGFEDRNTLLHRAAQIVPVFESALSQCWFLLALALTRWGAVFFLRTYGHMKRPMYYVVVPWGIPRNLLPRSTDITNGQINQNQINQSTSNYFIDYAALSLFT
jgi:hypothetical protein